MKFSELKPPSNREFAYQRVMSLKRKFVKNPSFFKDYLEFVNKMLANNYAEKATNREETNVWYIPHHGVYHPQKPEKIRVVFDCSARFRGFSLNDNLLQGPDLTNSLLGVLCRFRLEPIAIMGDIQAMFHQVELPEKDRDLLRFLWWKDGNLNEQPQEYRMKVYPFGAVCSPSCANLALRKTAEDNKSEYQTKASDAVFNNFYVDDCLISTANEEEAISLILQLSDLLQKGGFNITKWVSNSNRVLQTVPKADRAAKSDSLRLPTQNPDARALGLLWSTQTDKFCFDMSNIKNTCTNRRQLLSIVNSIYDPLGFLAPVILPMKILQQQLCRQKLSWDDSIDAQSLSKFNAWIDEIKKIYYFQVNRCIKPCNFGKIKIIEFHHFSDASEDAYSSVSYIRLINEFSEVHTSILLAKCRLTPISTSTIPRLELNAATMSVKNDKFLRKEMQFVTVQSYFWTDSTTVLRYIRNESRAFKTFVANRVAFIRNNSTLSQWFYVPSSCNPADKATRIMSAEEFLECSLWKNGPSFLQRSYDSWPDQPDFISASSETDTEYKLTPKVYNVSVSICTTVDDLFCRFSKWTKLKSTIAWLLRFRNNLQRSRSGNALNRCFGKEKSKTIQPLSVEELEEAEIQVVKFLQRKYFSDELQTLSSGQTVKKSNRLVSLDCFLDDRGIIRVGGRLSSAPIMFNKKHQILIPHDSNIAVLLIDFIHATLGHVGRLHVLSMLREKYWITKANSLARSVLNRCYECQKIHGTLGKQKMADLPPDRVTPGMPPFSFVGIDFFGPFTVKRGRCSVKRYGVLFTCLVLRAVHIEISHTLDTSSFINALRRFIARRGPVIEIRSDNATNFVGAEKELKLLINEWNQTAIHKFLLQKQIKWIFNTPAASHHGGVWERCIRSVRKILSSVVKQQTLDDESLTTFMCEVENIINSRPLTPVSNDVKDLQPLTPNMLLCLKEEHSMPPGTEESFDVYSKKRWKRVQYLSNLFWKRWVKEYLPILQKRQKWTNLKENFNVGDVVIIADDNLPRNAWHMGVILETPTDKRGVVRSAKIKTATSVLDRPITKLCLITAAETVQTNLQ